MVTDDASIRRRDVLALGAALGAQAALPAYAEKGFPEPGRPIVVIIPAPPGGPADILARSLAPFASSLLENAPIVVEGKPGGASVPAALAVAHAAPDGYTLFLGINTTHTQVPHMFARPPYDPFKDFTPITQIYRNGSILVANPRLPVSDLTQLIEYSRVHGPIAAGSPGAGTNGHLYIEMLNRQYGARLNHVPYRGSSDAMRDLLGGFVQVLFDSPATSLPQLRAGRLKALAVTGPARMKVLPDVRTAHEQGCPALDVTGWMGFFGPAKMPEDIVTRLNAAWVAAVRRPEIRARFEPLGLDLTGTTAAEFAAIIRSDYDTWGKIIRDAGVRLD